MTTLYYPRLYFNRWRWSTVVTDDSKVTPSDCCTLTLCDGHESPEDAVRHHAEHICIKSDVIRRLSTHEMRPCAVCGGWSEHYAVLSMCPYDDRVYICERHSEDIARLTLRQSHFKWRGVSDNGNLTSREKVESHYLSRSING